MYEVHCTALILVTCYLLPITCSAQTIKGRITDANSNQTLPFVGVLVKGTQTGTLTDIDGKFQLTIPSVQNIELQVSYLGYQPQTIALNSYQDIEKINVKLKPQAVSLQEISVKAGENPAHRIIKNAMKTGIRTIPKKCTHLRITAIPSFL